MWGETGRNRDGAAAAGGSEGRTLGKNRWIAVVGADVGGGKKLGNTRSEAEEVAGSLS